MPQQNQTAHYGEATPLLPPSPPNTKTVYENMATAEKPHTADSRIRVVEQPFQRQRLHPKNNIVIIYTHAHTMADSIIFSGAVLRVKLWIPPKTCYKRKYGHHTSIVAVSLRVKRETLASVPHTYQIMHTARARSIVSILWSGARSMRTQIKLSTWCVCA